MRGVSQKEKGTEEGGVGDEDIDSEREEENGRRLERGHSVDERKGRGLRETGNPFRPMSAEEERTTGDKRVANEVSETRTERIRLSGFAKTARRMDERVASEAKNERGAGL